MAALSVLHTHTHTHRELPTYLCKKAIWKGGNVKTWKSEACNGHISKGERVKHIKPAKLNEREMCRDRTNRTAGFAGGKLVSGKYLWYFQLATEWFMTSWASPKSVAHAEPEDPGTKIPSLHRAKYQAILKWFPLEGSWKFHYTCRKHHLSFQTCLIIKYFYSLLFAFKVSCPED